METAMILKTGIFALLTMGFAGGAIYYGTDIADPNTSKGTVELAPRVEKNETPKAATRELRGSETAHPKAPIRETPKAGDVKPERLDIPEVSEETVTTVRTAVTETVTTSDEIRPGDIILLVLNEIENIETVVLKDQAYLDVVNYAVKNDLIEAADAAMKNINQVELRDTARSQIAISLAMHGKIDDAFVLIDDVEIDALRDVMRLQVIEAIIAPQNLPPAYTQR